MDIQKISAWAKSNGELPIDLYVSSPLEKLKTSPIRPLLFFGGVHGDEPEGVKLAESTLEWLSSQEAHLIRPFALITDINPDGSRNNTRTNGRGVDLNRNYPSSGWKEDFEQERYNPGPEPGSEPETQALVQLMSQIKPSLVVHCHSWEPCIVLTGPPEIPEAKVFAETTGYPLQASIGYPTPGSLSEYCWVDHQIPVICLEAQEKSDLNTVWPIFKKGIEFLFLNR